MKTLLNRNWTLALLMLLVSLTSLPLAQATPETWTETGSMNSQRSGHTATVLANGKVLVSGGNGNGYYAGAPLSSAELYDPATGIWTNTGPMSGARSGHTAILLANGKVLVSGGYNYISDTPNYLSTAELYPPGPFTLNLGAAAQGMITGNTSPYPPNEYATLTATPDPGYVFIGWTGDASGTANPLSVLMDSNKTIGATFGPDLSDADGDGFEDLFEVNTGFNPALATSTPDALSSIRTAVEFRFNAANGVSYRIEASTDLEEWTTIETNIIGESAVVTRFYSIENQPRRYFRVRRN